MITTSQSGSRHRNRSNRI